MGWRQRLVLGFSLVLVGCGRIPSPANEADPFSITHGYVIEDGDHDPHPEVVRLKKASTGGLCTGTFIATTPPTIATASHCLSALPTAGNDSGGVKYRGVAAVRACVPTGAMGVRGPEDLAVIVFRQGSVAVPGVRTRGPTVPAVNLPVTLVGFGRNDVSKEPVEPGGGIKRVGMNRIRRIGDRTDPAHDTMLYLRGALRGDLETREEVAEARDSVTAKGDSGGPLFLETRNGLELVGVTSSGGPTTGGNAFSWFVSFHAPRVKAFLDGALRPEFLRALAGATRPAGYETVCKLGR